MYKTITLLFAICSIALVPLHSQESDTSLPRAGIKTNLLYDLTGTINLGGELRLGSKHSVDISGDWNPFSYSDNRKWKHLLIQPEYRYWTDEAFRGHFFGLHAHYSYYNVGNLPKKIFSENMKNHRYQGWLAGAGITYGYRWNLNRRWGLEASIGIGYAYMDYDKYDCAHCGKKLESKTRNYFGPTKAGISLVYNLGGKKKAASQPETVYIPIEEPEVIIEEVPLILYTPQYEVSYVSPQTEEVKRRQEVGSAYLDFPAGGTQISPSFRNNAAELQKLHMLMESLKNDPDATITGITITGYASPEGLWARNKTVSEERAATLKNYIKTKYGYPESLFVTEGLGEDWQTLDSLVAHSSMEDKSRILEIIRGTGIFDGRERKLMELSGGNPYRAMKADFFPRLRRTEYRLHYTVVPFEVEKGKEIFRIKPAKLSLNELYLIANSYVEGSDEFNEIFETAARIFPDDDTANLNAAANALSRKDTVSAEGYLSKVKGHNAAYHNNRGVLYGLKQEWGKASEAFSQARQAGNDRAAKNAEETQRAVDSRAAK